MNEIGSRAGKGSARYRLLFSLRETIKKKTAAQNQLPRRSAKNSHAPCGMLHFRQSHDS